MPRICEGKIALGGLAAFAVWLFVALPLLYYPASSAQNVSSPSQTAQEANGSEDKSTTDWFLVAIGALQLLVFGYQALKLRQTVDAASEQIRDMKQSVAEAARSANAMERVATHIAVSATAAQESVATLKERTAAQMRAYLSIQVGSAVYQEREKNLRFDARPTVVNSGHTPAYNVDYRIKAAILPVPLPSDFTFPLPEVPQSVATVGPQQNRILHAVVDDYVGDADVADIKLAKGRALFVWGRITYEDAFKEARFTNFCLNMFWVSDTQLFGYYNLRHNDSD